jgi:lipopolysaccharide transport system ATP-binding protein
VKFADIGEYIDQPVKSYSSGMYVRLAFAVIAHVDADVLVIDEALAVGDAFFTQKCMRFLRTFMNKGTVLFVSHDTASVKGLCSHAMWLDKGMIKKQGKPKEICENYLEAFFEEQQGTSFVKNKIDQNEKKEVAYKDQRQKFINNSNIRNDIHVFEFNPKGACFGKGDARILKVELHDSIGNPISWIVGGEEVVLKIYAVCTTGMNSPIIGFFVNDRLGQCLFGDNTYITSLNNPISCNENDIIASEFKFYMPRLPVGDYSITVAIANGSQENHVQHHWIHDALIFRSEASSVSSGLVGIPMNDIQLKVKNEK